jgi:hypothetical protein
VVFNVNCPNDSTVVSLSVRPDCGWDPISTTEHDFTDISVSPNPASNHLKIINSSNTAFLNIEIFDMNGRVVLTENK